MNGRYGIKFFSIFLIFFFLNLIILNFFWGVNIYLRGSLLPIHWQRFFFFYMLCNVNNRRYLTIPLDQSFISPIYILNEHCVNLARLNVYCLLINQNEELERFFDEECNDLIRMNSAWAKKNSFFGGRTGNNVKIYDRKEGEIIKYVDYCSLYHRVIWGCNIVGTIFQKSKVKIYILYYRTYWYKWMILSKLRT